MLENSQRPNSACSNCPHTDNSGPYWISLI
jgi:hypothetical protein